MLKPDSSLHESFSYLRVFIPPIVLASAWYISYDAATLVLLVLLYWQALESRNPQTTISFYIGVVGTVVTKFFFPEIQLFSLEIAAFAFLFGLGGIYTLKEYKMTNIRVPQFPGLTQFTSHNAVNIDNNEAELAHEREEWMEMALYQILYGLAKLDLSRSDEELVRDIALIEAYLPRLLKNISDEEWHNYVNTVAGGGGEKIKKAAHSASNALKRFLGMNNNSNNNTSGSNNEGEDEDDEEEKKRNNNNATNNKSGCNADQHTGFLENATNLKQTMKKEDKQDKMAIRKVVIACENKLIQNLAEPFIREEGADQDEKIDSDAVKHFQMYHLVVLGKRFLQEDLNDLHHAILLALWLAHCQPPSYPSRTKQQIEEAEIVQVAMSNTYTAFEDAFNKLVQKGYIQKVGTGKYRLVQ